MRKSPFCHDPTKVYPAFGFVGVEFGITPMWRSFRDKVRVCFWWLSVAFETSWTSSHRISSTLLGTALHQAITPIPQHKTCLDLKEELHLRLFDEMSSNEVK
jgi:hypothetical protein